MVYGQKVQPGRECRTCGEDNIVNMRKCADRIDGHDTLCLLCYASNMKQYRKSRGKTFNEYRRKYRALNADEINAYKRAQYAKDSEKYRERSRKWAKDNPHKHNINSHNYRARQAEAIVEKFDILEVFERDNYICYLCGKLTDPNLQPWDELRTVLEHKIPLSRGGSHSLDNCATACARDNSRKKDKTVEEYLALVGKEGAL